MFESIEEESHALREERILRFWREQAIFEKSLEQRKGKPLFSFYDGPPFATGLPHYGHLLAGTMKDAILRYKTMQGYFAPRRFGWDCHGLPVEQEIEKSFNLSGAPAIEAFGIEQFNEECRKIVLRYTEQWRHTVERMGRWVDFSATWTTMDLGYMESVWWVFKQVYERGLIYEGYKVVPYSAKLGTPLSNFEAAENYRDIDDPSVVVAFALCDDPSTALLAWTTTPWTLVSNMALAVHPEVTYVKVQMEPGECYLLAKEAVERWLTAENHKVVGTFLGKELIGKHYKPLFPYFCAMEAEGAFRVVGGDFVEVTEGTGIVHMAPAFGEIDFLTCKQEKIPLVCPVDQNGRFTHEIKEYEGKFVKEADKEIIKRLKVQGSLFFSGRIRHRYPFCWRSDTPLIYRAISTWFLCVEAIKERVIKANAQVHWVPSHLKEGRFGKWLEGARDWAISRNRYWGTPLPIWKSDEGDIHIVGSIKELKELTGVEVTDLHRHTIDALSFTKEGKRYERVKEVFDCWFDAGSMPYAQNHYPFENKELTEKGFPADFIAEGIDQTRGWFYTLLILSTALFDRAAYKNVVVNGIILTEQGNKMSKRLKNYPEPDIVINKYGADAVRLYLLASPVVKGDDLCFSEKGVEQTLRAILLPLWNAHVFYHTYASIYHYEPREATEDGITSEAILDRWILSSLSRLVERVEGAMERYELSEAVEPLLSFIDALTNWYIRRSRRRFWEDQDPIDQKRAFGTLHHVLIVLTRLVAPFIPFMSEAIYQRLKTPDMPLSVHLADFPKSNMECRDTALEAGMEALRIIVSVGHALRKESKLKVRQPLLAMHLVVNDPDLIPFLESHQQLIMDELNVKAVLLHRERREFMQFAIKPNFRALGKRVGEHMRELQLFISMLSQEEISKLQAGHALTIKVGQMSFELTLDDVEIVPVAKEGWAALHAGPFIIALDTKLDEPLILEGIARELVNKINTMRKEANLAVTDRIRLYFATTAKVRQALEIHSAYVMQEVLAVHISYECKEGASPWDINGEPTQIALERVTV